MAPGLAGSLAGSLAGRGGGSLAGGGATLEGIFGGKLRLEYEAAHYTPGTGGVASAPNREGTAAYDVAQAVTGNRPDPVTEDTFAAWDFIAANADYLSVLNAGDFSAIADTAVIYAVLKPNAAGDSNVWMEVGTSATASGMSVRQLGGIYRIQVNTVVTGAVLLNGAVAPTASPSIVTGFLDATDLYIRVNGTEATATAAGGLTNACDSVGLGDFFTGTGQEADGNFFHGAFATNVTYAKALEGEAFLANKYGITLA